VKDLVVALAHYRTLGFKTSSDDPGYGFADRDGLSLHLSVRPPDVHPGTVASTYLYVRDADALYQQWSQPGIGGQTGPVDMTPYQFREGSHVDLDGNLIRFGSPVEE